MKNPKIVFRLYAALLFIAVILSIWQAFSASGESSYNLIKFNEGWKTEDGRMLSLDQLPAFTEGQKMRLVHEIPSGIDEEDGLSLISHNIYFTVKIDDRTVYHYYPKSNITGKGYGDAIHRILLNSSDKNITILCESIYPNERSAFFKDSMIGSHDEFNGYLFRKNGLAFAIAFIVFIAGILTMILHISSFRIAKSEYHLPSLAIMVMLAGAWSMVETSIPELIIPNHTLLRMVEYGALAFVGYPMVVFVNSVTVKKRPIYEWISLGTTIVFAGIMAGLRLFAGIDMHNTNVCNLLNCGIALIIAVIAIVEDLLDHRRHHRKYVNRALYVGGAMFVVGAAIDLYLYFSSGKSVVNNGIFMQLGFLVFIVLIMMQAQRRMLIEHRLIDHQRFINRLLQYSYSGQSAEVIINQMLKYLGEETGADRTYIFEERADRLFDNTFEWCREGVSEEIDNLQKIPYEGLIQTWYEEFRRSGVVSIYNLEEYRKVNEKIADLFEPQGVDTLITCPLGKDGSYIGFFGLDNPPREKMQNMVTLVKLLEFFIVMMLKQRDNQEQLIRYSYVDHLTGVMNRRSLERIRKMVEKDKIPFGMLMCDINGLKKMNDEQGHDAGDEMIRDIADSLKEAFGDRRVFRMGGDEFLVVREGGTREQFERAVYEVRQFINARGRSVSVGFAFSDETDDFEKLQALADERMYEDKRRFYASGRSADRRR